VIKSDKEDVEVTLVSTPNVKTCVSKGKVGTAGRGKSDERAVIWDWDVTEQKALVCGSVAGQDAAVRRGLRRY